MLILVCIPTLTGREAYLRNCQQAYIERSLEANVIFSITHDAPSCGVGWNRCVERAIRHPPPDYIHFSNDDIVVAEGWLPPLIEAASWPFLPVSRIEPAGVQLGEFSADDPPIVPTSRPPRISKHGYFYADLPQNQPTQDWEWLAKDFQHGALPFCSREQFEQIGPFIPIHFGTDKWFYDRARRLGMQPVARQGSVIYNYAAQVGRAKGDWTEQDYLDFDLTVAYPMYVSGELGVSDEHPLRNTPEGLTLVREWRKRTFG